MLAKAFKYGRKKQILQWFVEVVEHNHTTFEQTLLGNRGINTVDPRNIEAVLSTNFNGMTLPLTPIPNHQRLYLILKTDLLFSPH
jgi:hypothetical protein